MVGCVFLSDDDVHEILINLTKNETLSFLDQVATSLKNFSVSGEAEYQPEPAIINRADGRRNLFRPFTSSTGVGVKIIVDPSQALVKESKPDTAERRKLMGLHGILALCDQNGFPIGFINAEEITGYRTSLSAMILYVRRQKTANIVVFGAGKQALWHIRLALTLRGDEIKRITVVNRSAERTSSLLAQIKEENQSRWKASVDFDSVQPGDEAELESILSQADVVFCTTPSKEALFPARLIGERGRPCYISAIGSWQANMIEVDPELVKGAAEMNSSKGMLVVDDRKECLKGAGEIVQSQLKEDKFAEVGEVLDLLEKSPDELQKKTKQCLETGFVIYKSVGVSVTDLAAGQAVLELAKQKNVGISVPKF